MIRYTLAVITLLIITISQQSQAMNCKANDLLVYNMALANMQASSFRQQKPIYIQVPEAVKHHRITQGYFVSVNVFAITNPSPLSPKAFQARLGKASANDFARITFKVSNAPGAQACTNIQPAQVEITKASTLSWLDIPAPKKIVKSI